MQLLNAWEAVDLDITIYDAVDCTYINGYRFGSLINLYLLTNSINKLDGLTG